MLAAIRRGVVEAALRALFSRCSTAEMDELHWSLRWCANDSHSDGIKQRFHCKGLLVVDEFVVILLVSVMEGAQRSEVLRFQLESKQTAIGTICTMRVNSVATLLLGGNADIFVFIP